MSTAIDRDRLARLMEREEQRFRDEHPRSAALHEQARGSMAGGVPMSWMAKWAGPFPVYVESASGSRFTDVDGREYVDLCLGDTGSMTGHSPAATVRAVQQQVERGITAMLPTENGIVVAQEMARRFGLPLWQFTLSATDANRHAIRYARMLTGRPRIGSEVFLGAGSIVIGNISVGDNVIVAAGSVVVGDIPSSSLVAGNPARVIRTLGPGEARRRLGY